MLIHFNGDLPLAEGGDGKVVASARWLDCTHVVDWYCRGAGERSDSVHVLLPEELKTHADEVSQYFGHVSVLWYNKDDAPSLPTKHRDSRVWVINGAQLPVVDWNAARSAVRHNAADVLLFGPSSITAKGHYCESVLVETTGEVVGFKRHYDDSPAFADLWTGDASFLAASAENATSVVRHVLARGWNLESVGAMTRRFNVRWSDTPCALSELGPAAHAAGTFGPAAHSKSEAPERRNGRNGNGHNHNGHRVSHSLDFATTKGGMSKPIRVQLLSGVPGVISPKTSAGLGGVDAKGAASTPANSQQCSNDDKTPRTDLKDGQVTSPCSLADLPPADPRYLFAKRTIDVIASALGLIVLSPLLLFVVALIKCTSRGPVLFGHRRQGRGGKEFHCLKFRSMRIGAEALQAQLRAQNEVDGPQFKIERDPRLTKVGCLIRRLNIDELPQLFNVLNGQMSLVGPRPSPDCENQLCPAWRRTRLSVKPGITGLWQVLRIRDDSVSDFQEWIYYDVEYAKHQSLWLDVQLLLYTPMSMFAPNRLAGFAGRLKRRGICTYAARLHSPKRTAAA